MAELTDRELRQITFTSRLRMAHFDKKPFTIHVSEITQIWEDLVAIAKERNQLEDEVAMLSSLVLGEPHGRYKQGLDSFQDEYPGELGEDSSS